MSAHFPNITSDSVLACHFADCVCGWEGQERATFREALSDAYAHVADTKEPDPQRLVDRLSHQAVLWKPHNAVIVGLLEEAADAIGEANRMLDAHIRAIFDAGKQVEDLQRALRRYGYHLPDCEMRSLGPSRLCTCGFSKSLFWLGGSEDEE